MAFFGLRDAPSALGNGVVRKWARTELSGFFFFIKTYDFNGFRPDFKWILTGLDERQITHLICARLKYDLYDFFRGCSGPASFLFLV